MEDETKRSSSLILFVVLAYGALWGLFGLGRWLAIPFSMDPRTPGGVFYLVGAALPSSCAIIAVLVFEGWAGLSRLMQRSLAWRLRWWLLGLPAGAGMATARAICKLWHGAFPLSGIWRPS